MIPESNLRPYLGAYINLARNNMFSTLRFINSSVGATGGIDDNEAQMFKMSILNKNVNLSPEQETQARRLFLHHFPFLKYLSSDQEDLTVPFEKMRNAVRSYANVLSWWRNLYSHSRATEVTGGDPEKERTYYFLRMDEQTVCRMLELIPTVSARIIKERYSSKNEAQKGMLAEDSMEFLTKSRYKPSKTPDGKRTMVMNERHFLFPKRQGNALRNGKNPDRLSISGMIQLICLFLEKKYITEFLSQIQFLSGFSDTAAAPRMPQRRLVLETMSALRIRLPESRLQSDRDEVQVALDILGELKKCPAEIYELLSAEDKAAFAVQSSNGDSVLFRRSSDRFVPLALSYLDTTRAFKKLRFQVNAGVFRYLFNENKRCVDGQERIRVLQEPLNGFGRIQEVEQIRSSEDRKIWKEYRILGFEDTPRNDASCLPYISDAYTRYVFDGDNIGMRIDGDYLPEITLREDGVHYNVPCRQADCTISRFSLPAMLFYHLLRPLAKGNTKSAEDLIANAVDSYRRFFSDIAEGRLNPISNSETEEMLTKRIEDTYGIPSTEIPDKIKDYLFKKHVDPGRFEKHKKALLREMKEETERRLERILEQKKTVLQDFNPKVRSDNKPGKRGYVQIKPGNLASYLAKDIVLLQEGTDKLTGLNFAVMQGAMAKFSSHNQDGRAELMRLFKSAGLIAENGEAGTHPFLYMVMKEPLVNDTVNLYIKYLRAKISFLSGSVPNSSAFLHAERSRWAERDEKYYRDLAKRYCEQPIAMTGKIFEEPMKDILLGLKDPRITEELTTKPCNMAYMIQLFQNYYLDDGPQCFYGLSEGDMEHEHNYRLYSLIRKYPKETAEILKDLDKDSVYYKTLKWSVTWVKAHPVKAALANKKPSSPKPEYSEICRSIRAAYKELTETERLIRRLATQDTVLFMAASSYLKRVWGLPKKDNSLKLYQIGRSDEPGVLDKRLQNVVKQVRFDWKDSTDNKAPLSHKNVAVEVKDICIKDYGEIYKLISDRRVASLVHHLDVNAISTEELKKELDTYDNRRVGVFKDIFEYENNILNSASDAPESPDFNDVLRLDTSHNHEEKLISRLIRNGFCHNSYPTKTARSDAKEVIIYEEGIPEVADSMARKISKFSKKKKE